VSGRRGLRRAVRAVRSTYGQAAVIEQLVQGRTISVALVGNADLEILPLVEIIAGSRKVCPAEIDDANAKRIRGLARAAFRAVGCRDYARVDVRLTTSGDPIVMDVRCGDLFARGGTFVRASNAAGYGLGGVLRRIVGEAQRRYLSPLAENGPMIEPAGVVSLTERRAAAARA
jgi:D-alanine-D-alanine ligase